MSKKNKIKPILINEIGLKILYKYFARKVIIRGNLFYPVVEYMPGTYKIYIESKNGSFLFLFTGWSLNNFYRMNIPVMRRREINAQEK